MADFNNTRPVGASVNRRRLGWRHVAPSRGLLGRIDLTKHPIEDLPQAWEYRQLALILVEVPRVDCHQIAIRIHQESLSGPAPLIHVVVGVDHIPLVDVVLGYSLRKLIRRTPPGIGQQLGSAAILERLDVLVGDDLLIGDDRVARCEQQAEPSNVTESAEEAARKHRDAVAGRQKGRVALGTDPRPDLA